MTNYATEPAPATSQPSAVNTQPASNDKEISVMENHTSHPAPAAPQLPAVNPKPVPVAFVPGTTFEPGNTYPLLLKDVQIDASTSSRISSLDDATIADLADNIRIHGMLQPIIVRTGSEGFIVVAGERRYRAAILARLESIPAMFNAENPALISLIENLQRTDLTGIQKAEALARLQKSDPKTFTVKHLAEMISRHTNRISEDLKIAELPVEVLDKYRDNIKCNCSLLRTARRAYDDSQKALGVPQAPEKYAPGLIEYIDSILAGDITAGKLLAAKAAAKKAKKLSDEASKPGETPSDNTDNSGAVPDESTTDPVSSAEASGAKVELDEVDAPSTLVAIAPETTIDVADAAVTSVKALCDSLIGVVANFDLDHKQAIASMLKELLALVE